MILFDVPLSSVIKCVSMNPGLVFDIPMASHFDRYNSSRRIIDEVPELLEKLVFREGVILQREASVILA